MFSPLQQLIPSITKRMLPILLDSIVGRFLLPTETPWLTEIEPVEMPQGRTLVSLPLPMFPFQLHLAEIKKPVELRAGLNRGPPTLGLWTEENNNHSPRIFIHPNVLFATASALIVLRFCFFLYLLVHDGWVLLRRWGGGVCVVGAHRED